MSKQSDFLELLTPLWNIEQFNMWNPKEHLSLAYLIDRMYDMQGYREKYAEWYTLASNKDFNEFGWTISQAIYLAAQNDPDVPKEELNKIEAFLKLYKTRYDAKKYSIFGNISEDFAPNWFWELFGGYIKIAEIKRENAIKEYLVDKCQMSPKRANDSYEKLKKHSDLLNEFYFFVQNGRFKSFYPKTSEGFTAQQLFETTYLSPLGAYNYLIYLRENPKEALEDLRKGLPRK